MSDPMRDNTQNNSSACPHCVRKGLIDGHAERLDREIISGLEFSTLRAWRDSGMRSMVPKEEAARLLEAYDRMRPVVEAAETLRDVLASDYQPNDLIDACDAALCRAVDEYRKARESLPHADAGKGSRDER